MIERARLRALPALAAFTLTLTACECTPPPPLETDAGIPTTVDAGHPGLLSVDLPTDLGKLRLLDVTTFHATVRNDGEVPFQIGVTTFSHADFAVVTQLPSTLAPHESAELVFTVRPQATGRIETRLRLVINSFVEDQTIFGFVVGPALSLSPFDGGLGMVPLFDGVGARAELEVLLFNAGFDDTPSPESRLNVHLEAAQTFGPPATLCFDDSCTGLDLTLDTSDSALVHYVLTTASEGRVEFEVRLTTNDPRRPLETQSLVAEVVRRSNCQYRMTGDLSFGSMNPKDVRELPVLFENTGTEPCSIDALAVDQNLIGFSEVLFTLGSAPPTPFDLSPGSAFPLTVRAEAPGADTFGQQMDLATLRIDTPTSLAPARRMVTSVLGQSCLSVLPAGGLDFGTIRIGCHSERRQLFFTNRCGTALQVRQVVAPSPTFTATSLATTLLAGATATVDVEYHPTVPGPEVDALRVSWRDQAEQHTTIQLRGEGTNASTATERWPPLTNTHDVLVVLSETPSMAARNALVQARLAGLLAQLQGRSIDFHLAALNASDASGVLLAAINGERVIDTQTSNPASRWNEILRSQGGASPVSCARVVLQALSPPLATRQLNGDFRRPHTPLTVICISDEADPDALALPHLRALGEPGVPLTWHAIVPTDVQTAATNCNLNAPLTLFDSHRVLTEATNGRRQDLCGPNWDGVIDAIAGFTQSPRLFFPLVGRPDPFAPAHQVNVSGVGLSQTDFQWDAGTNVLTIRDSSSVVPSATSQVDISWSAACNP